MSWSRLYWPLEENGLGLTSLQNISLKLSPTSFGRFIALVTPFGPDSCVLNMGILLTFGFMGFIMLDFTHLEMHYRCF